MVRKKKEIEKKPRKRVVKKEEKYPRNKVNEKYYYSASELIIMSFVSIFLGLIVGLMISYVKTIGLDSSDGKVTEILTTYNSIVNSYYGKVDKDKLVDGAINGMINSLDDPYSVYVDKEANSSVESNLDGYFEGIGVNVGYSGGNVAIYGIYKNSFAEKAGLKNGDLIIEINGTNVEDYTVGEISKLIKSSSSPIKMTVKRDGKKKKVVVRKGRVEIYSVSSKVVENDIGYIKVSNFALNTASQFNSNLISLEKKNIKSLIIDLRGNLGGHLNQADDILDLFFKRGTVIYQVENHGKKVEIKAKTNRDKSYPVVILIDENSASASEILASCFKENYKDVTLVGKESYGKGTIQKEVKLSTGASVKYTTEKWYTSKGVWLDHDTTGGLKVDLDVTNQDNNDNQLDKAIELLKKE